MRSLPCFVLLISLVTGGIAAQTTGVPGINDYTINGIGSGSTSCTQVAVGGSVNSMFSVSTTPGVPVIFFFSLCPCNPGNFCMTSPVCTMLPMTACGGSSNQSIDIDPACILSSSVVVSNAVGHANLQLFIPYGLTFSTQAFVFDPTGGGCASPLLPGTLTQAYDVYTLPV